MEAVVLTLPKSQMPKSIIQNSQDKIKKVEFIKEKEKIYKFSAILDKPSNRTSVQNSVSPRRKIQNKFINILPKADVYNDYKDL